MLAAAGGLAATAPGRDARAGEQACRPTLAVTPVGTSQSPTPGGWRTWTALIHADPSPCAALSGVYELVLALEKENAPDLEVREPALWRAGPVRITRELWIDEAVAGARIDNVAPCPCRR